MPALFNLCDFSIGSQHLCTGSEYYKYQNFCTVLKWHPHGNFYIRKYKTLCYGNITKARYLSPGEIIKREPKSESANIFSWTHLYSKV